MKKFAYLFALALMAYLTPVQAQDKPMPSPTSKVEQKAGTTDITIEYSRPGVKDRKVFAADGLVPYGKLWRTGANGATKITFSKDVMVEGKSLPAGSYAILTSPTASEWTVNFYKFNESGFNAYMEKTPDLSVMVKPEMLNLACESFLITLNDLRDDSATLQFIWDKTVVPVKLGLK
ncbi:MAG TPA: DUF2911 domain-containing protein [Saprospiraceae bacterium]|nr:DUF2911 domain-containing protein [Saprospiraceae bacterium]MCB9270927.1 DUF2911 domain-containing protein [Lewinellaceae bacterium]HPG08190.1 DUF2911 domain-containing protein [Saprospiraceae bacterium]HPQ98190.1 DUF2911 domain-containing protein [Saprospiraceae bacterium]HQU52067.1 DUF2911 domain-containing protein [Saprospiraceae bacterium]